MIKHRDDCISEQADDLGLRIHKAFSFLQSSLQAWDVKSSLHVGFEILIPAHLAMLEGFGLNFSFPCRTALMALNKKKLAKFDPQLLYGRQKTTLLHSLEAFVGKVDFNRVRHHAVGGSMMASPSSTAAYLMHSSPWDDAAEAYIRNCISHGSGQGSGGVPSAYPTTIFEITWIFSTLLESGVSSESLGGQASGDTTKFLMSQLDIGNGTLGFGQCRNSHRCGLW